MISDKFAYFRLYMFCFMSHISSCFLLFLRLIFVFSLPAARRASLLQTDGPEPSVVPKLYTFIHILIQVYAK